MVGFPGLQKTTKMSAAEPRYMTFEVQDFFRKKDTRLQQTLMFGKCGDVYSNGRSCRSVDTKIVFSGKTTGGEPLFATPCCNTSRATWSTPSEPPHMNPFLKSCRFRLCLVQAAVVNLFVLNLVCFISVCPCIPETGRLENTYSCCGFWLWSWLAVVNLFVLNVVLHFRLPKPETGRL